jgi:riboflavin synthase
MFTGIIEELGNVTAMVDLGDAARLSVRGPLVVGDARHGDSIAVNGVCLTVVEVAGDAFTADVMKETLDRTALGALTEGDPVNLERAATLGGRLGGHLVQGHVDGVGTILDRVPAEHWDVVTIWLPPGVGRYVVEKGSITVDGVSLTVAAVDGSRLSVSLIPATLERTTLGRKASGAPVNLEVDIVAKYIEKLVDVEALRGGRS